MSQKFDPQNAQNLAEVSNQPYVPELTLTRHFYSDRETASATLDCVL
jgi:hypothetical protein